MFGFNLCTTKKSINIAIRRGKKENISSTMSKIKYLLVKKKRELPWSVTYKKPGAITHHPGSWRTDRRILASCQPSNTQCTTSNRTHTKHASHPGLLLLQCRQRKKPYVGSLPFWLSKILTEGFLWLHCESGSRRWAVATASSTRYRVSCMTGWGVSVYVNRTCLSSCKEIVGTWRKFKVS